MTQTEALRLALEALELVSIEFVCNGAHHAKKDRHEWLDPCPIVDRYKDAITAIKAALEAKDEPVAHSVVAGALFDFMGWLTSREKRLILSSVDEASPAVEAITEFAKKRNLSLKYAEVGYWTEFLSTSPQQEAKDKPVAWMHVQGNHEEPSFRQLDDWEIQNGWKQYPLYTAPPQRTWINLTLKEIELLFIENTTPKSTAIDFARAIETKFKEKNT